MDQFENMDNERIRIAYIGLEIPALSATFIYNEILQLEKTGFKVIPLSVLKPGSLPDQKKLETLGKNTYYIYGETLVTFLISSVKFFFHSPIKYLSALLTAVKDSIKVGLISHIGIGMLYRFLVASRVSEILKRESCVHLHAHFAHVPTDIAMYVSMLSGVSFSFTSHANDLFERGWLLKEKVDRAGFAVTISEYNRRFLVNKGSLGEKIHVIHCGINTKFFSDVKGKQNNSSIQIGALGRLVEKKGFDTLIYACDLLKKERISFHVDLLGDGPLRNDIQSLIDKMGLSAQINLIGSIQNKQVPDWLKKKDIFVLPCRKDKQGDMDGIPVVLMEAMAMGMPVISSRISGIPELIDDGENGLLSEPGNAEDLFRAIKKIKCDPNLQIKFHTNAINKIHREFDLTKNVERLSNLLKGQIF